MSIYLDYNASARVRPEAVQAAVRAMELGANASSVHGAGRAARTMIEEARSAVAALIGAVPGAVTFTSGGTEANTLTIGSAIASGIRRLIVLATEHDSITAPAQASGLPVLTWPVDGQGLADLDWLRAALADGGPAMVCLAAANSETGVIQPLEAVTAITGPAGAWLHVDAVQAAGKIALDFRTLGADTLSLSAHKIGGPQGAGALVAASRITLTRLQHGGGQERGRRAGTENLSGIAGFGAAARACSLEVLAAQAAWRDAAAMRLKTAGAIVMGEETDRLPQTLCIVAPGFGSETQVMALDLAGYAVSAGSACSSGKVAGSRVITAMGKPEFASNSLRISGGWASTQNDWQGLADAWLLAYSRAANRKVA
jgi:cysteine desulfurase